MNHLIKCDLQVQLKPEESGYEFGYNIFDSLSGMETIEQTRRAEMSEINVIDEAIPIKNNDLSLTLSKQEFHKLQWTDCFCTHIITMLQNRRLQDRHPYFLKHSILRRDVTDNTQTSETLRCQSVSLVNYL